MHPEHSPAAYPQPESTRDVLDVLASGIAKMAASDKAAVPCGKPDMRDRRGIKCMKFMALLLGTTKTGCDARSRSAANSAEVQNDSARFGHPSTRSVTFGL